MNAVDTALHRGDRPFAPIDRRAAEMARAIREIVCRDGYVTEQALICEGFTAAEICEHYPDAEREARSGFIAEGQRADRVPDIIEKAIVAQAWTMPITAATPETEAMRLAWRDYCRSIAAHKLDPWLSQSERCLVRLKNFLCLLPLIETERNRIVTAVAGALKRRVNAG